VGQLQRRLMQAGLPPAAKEVAKRELRLLGTMKADHHDYSTYWGHLELMTRLQWHPDPVPPIDLDRVSRALDRDHFGLERPKKRILEYLAVRALGGKGGVTILCLAGPPGVGKTSIVASIAETLGRKLVRVALGGGPSISPS
jgi:ATP-dependent Lon protease